MQVWYRLCVTWTVKQLDMTAVARTDAMLLPAVTQQQASMRASSHVILVVTNTQQTAVTAHMKL